jgi:hypothetical protein
VGGGLEQEHDRSNGVLRLCVRDWDGMLGLDRLYIPVV